MSAYERRNTRARAAGWSGYGQMRRAKDLGYRSPREYTDAKQKARGEAVEPSPRPYRRTIAGVTVAGMGAAGGGVAGPWSALAKIERRLMRYRGSRRATIYVGGKRFGARGFSIDFLKARIAEHGSLEAWLEHVAASMGASDSEAGVPTGGDVSVTVQ